MAPPEAAMTKSKRKRLRRKAGQSRGTVQLHGTKHRPVEDREGELVEIRTRGFLRNLALDRALDAGHHGLSLQDSDSDDESVDLFSLFFCDSSSDDSDYRDYRRSGRSSNKAPPMFTKTEEVDGFVGHKDVDYLMNFIEGKGKKSNKGRSKASRKKKGKNGAPTMVNQAAEQTGTRTSASDENKVNKGLEQQARKFGGNKGGEQTNNKGPGSATKTEPGGRKETAVGQTGKMEQNANKNGKKQPQPQAKTDDQNVLIKEKGDNKKQDFNNNRGVNNQDENENNRKKNQQNKENEAGRIFGKDAKENITAKAGKPGLRKSAN